MTDDLLYVIGNFIATEVGSFFHNKKNRIVKITFSIVLLVLIGFVSFCLFFR